MAYCDNDRFWESAYRWLLYLCSNIFVEVPINRYDIVATIGSIRCLPIGVVGTKGGQHTAVYSVPVDMTESYRYDRQFLSIDNTNLPIAIVYQNVMLFGPLLDTQVTFALRQHQNRNVPVDLNYLLQ